MCWCADELGMLRWCATELECVAVQVSLGVLVNYKVCRDIGEQCEATAAV